LSPRRTSIERSGSDGGEHDQHDEDELRGRAALRLVDPVGERVDGVLDRERTVTAPPTTTAMVAPAAECIATAPRTVVRRAASSVVRPMSRWYQTFAT